MESHEDLAEHHTAAERHTKFVDELAQRVEERIVAKFARYLIVNAVAVFGLICAGMVAFFSLHSKVDSNIARDDLQDRVITNIQADATMNRAALDASLREIASKIDEINRFLRDHSNGAVPRK